VADCSPADTPAGQNFTDLAVVVYGFPRRTGGADGIRSSRIPPSFRHFREAIMNEDVFNVSVRKFLKKVGITSQREIEHAVRSAIADKRLQGNEALPAKIILTVEGLNLSFEIEGAIELE
jgi:hypothetical protein